MMNAISKPGCEYSSWTPTSPWKSFYHEESGPHASGPSKYSQSLALWYPGVHTNWPYIELKSLYSRPNLFTEIMFHYDCSYVDAMLAVSYINQFLKDVEKRFV